MGPMSLTTQDGNDLTPRSRKGQAVLAMLCTGRNGRRTRAWLQANLWSDRAPPQASGSLRSCLHELRAALGEHQGILSADRSIIEIDLSAVWVDLLDMTPMEWLQTVSEGVEFLEGLDLVDPQFNHWLTEQRAHWSKRAETAFDAGSPAAPAVPAAPLDRIGSAAQEVAQRAAQGALPKVAPIVVDPPLAVGLPDPAPAQPDWSLSLSVFPLENRTGDDRNTPTGYGLSEDLISRLQRLKWLPVIGTGGTFVQQQPRRGAGTAMAEGLGAHYFVEGSLSAERNRQVARFRLCQADTARVVWADTFDLEPVMADDTVDSVFDQVVSAIDRTVYRAMQRQVMATENRSEAFQDQLWRGRWHLARLTREDSEASRRHLEQALKLRPQSPEALIQMAFWHLWRTWVGREGELGLSAGEHLARQAMSLDADDGRVYALLGIAEAWRRNHNSAIAFFEQAVELNPNLAIAYHQLGSALNHADRPGEAIAPIAQAIRYSPRDQMDFAFQTEMAVALARMEHFEEAFVRASRALLSKPRYWYGHLVRIYAAEGMGDRDRIFEARRAFERSGARVTDQQLDWLPFRSGDFPDQLRGLI